MSQERNFKEILPEISTFLFDVDGVFTDNRVILLPGTDPVRTFNTRDAYAVQLAVKEGYRIIIVSGGTSQGVRDSFDRLGVREVFLGTSNKVERFTELVRSGLDPKGCAYMGDDIPDQRVMERVALPACPADAAEEIKAISAFHSRYVGGAGCVRDLLEQAMRVQNKWRTDSAYTW
ncbi:MAG: 3-deoxy-D-manno-octulosonate 8-phosphate phosphatase [Flavobacteriales bacterium]|nr:3-deoxy-D-manno-octulosonate 8-phosphate phosphatase [Flavobacteriales bacterium]